MQSSDLEYTHKRVIVSARILLAVLTPALLFSIVRTLTEDGAFGIILLQSFLWLVLVATCIEQVPLGLRGRISALVGILLMVALGSMIRNQSVFAAMPQAFLAGLYLSLVARSAYRYVVPVFIMSFFVVAAWQLNYLTAVAGLSHILGFGGALTAAIYLYTSMQQRAEQKAQDALDAISKLNMVTAEGDIGLYEFDFESESFTGNLVWRARLGLPAEGASIGFAEAMTAITEISDGEIAARLSEIKRWSVGHQNEEYLNQRHSDGSLIRIRIHERKVERNGRLLIVGAAVDVTAEYESSRKAADLQDRIDLVSRSGGVGMIESFPATKTFKCNAEFADRLGLPDSDEERSIDLLYAYQMDEFVAFHRQNIAEQLQFGLNTVVNFTHPFYLPSGEKRYYRVSRSSRTIDGRLSLLGLSIDVTDEVRANEEYENVYQNLKAACEGSGLYLIHTNLTKGDCEYIIAPTNNQTAPLSVDALLNAVPQEYHQALIAAHAEPGLSAEFPFLYPGWSEARWMRDSSVNHWVDEAGSKHSIILCQDIHEQKMKSLALEQTLDSLNQEQQKQALMYAVIGHELRTPAASMKMMLDDLDEGETLDSALVGSNIEHLLGVIDSLRAVAQPERMAQAAYKDVVIDELLSAQVANLSGLAKRSGITLTADLSNLTNQPAHIQSSLLCQVISNLIKNAIIHSEGDRIHLSAIGKLKGDHTKALTIRISDNGKGIDASKVDKLFEAYERGDSNAEGTGLGLFVCREIINIMGGDLHYETSEQGGAEFVIELVITLSDQGNEPTESVENLLDGKRVLMAEDNSVIQMLTAKMLKKQGATVVVNSDGQQALNAYSDGAFDLVMSDIFMPELDGYGLVKGLRERGYIGPIVGLTAATIGAETDLMLEAGADIVISKPIELEKLQTFLMEYMRQSDS